MPGPLDWWNRIRRVVGPPGAPESRAAVPTELDAARRMELGPIFEYLDRVEAELGSAERECDREVAAIVNRAEREASRLVADARECASTERGRAGAIRRTELARDAKVLRARAAMEAAATRDRARAALPALVERAVEEVRSFAIESDEISPGRER